MALTASVPADIEGTIVPSLHLQNPVFVHGDIDRPNIYLSVTGIKSLSVSLVQNIVRYTYVFLIYTNTREIWMV